MNRDMFIDQYVSSLATATPPARFRNPYQQPTAAHNLRVFLGTRDPTIPTILLVGEAPGYRGAALSGVPLSSLAILTEAWNDPWSAFGPGAGYRAPKVVPYSREATATIVWSCLSTLLRSHPLPLTWNAVPFHPVGGSPNSNAPLAHADVPLGREWLERLIDLFPKTIPVAVGNRACDALRSLSVGHYVVRHPARGGKSDFSEGIRDLMARRAAPGEPDTPMCTRCQPPP